MIHAHRNSSSVEPQSDKRRQQLRSAYAMNWQMALRLVAKYSESWDLRDSYGKSKESPVEIRVRNGTDRTTLETSAPNTELPRLDQGALMPEPKETTVVLADDQAIVREGFAALFAGAGMRVVGECCDGAEALQMIGLLQPDFAILDLYMPIMTGVDVVRRLRGSG